MRKRKAVKWLAFAALIISLLSLALDSDGHLSAAAVIMSACIVLTYSKREIKEES